MADRWRLIDDLDADIDAAGQMEADAALPALRLYRWVRPALSLGRFQPDTDVDHDACRERGVEIVRRPTGGRGLLHGADLTYAVAMMRPPGDAGRVDAVYERIAGALITGLAQLGVTASVARQEGPSGPVCFAGQQGADLRVGERKLCGSAQVNLGPAVLQHGSILLDRLPFDETDLLGQAPSADRRRQLRRATVTLAELGAPNAPQVVADALVVGFTLNLDLELSPRVASGASTASARPLLHVQARDPGR
jgi:lipoyl(octanoyl) transferase